MHRSKYQQIVGIHFKMVHTFSCPNGLIILLQTGISVGDR